MSEETTSGNPDLEPEETEEEEANNGRRLTDAEKAEIRELFELGQMGTVELAKKFGITRQALSRWFKREGITKGSRAHELQAAINKGVKNAVGQVAGQQVIQQLERYADKRLDWIEETRVTAIKDLKLTQQLAKKVVADAIKDKKPISTVDDDLKAIHRAQKILEQNADARLRILRSDNIVDEDDLPKLIIEDLTADQLIEFHTNNGVEDEDEIDAILENYDKDPTES